MAKNVPRSKFTELRGLDRISQITHEMNCLFRVISQDDVGIDGEIEVVTPKPEGSGFQTSGGIIKVQAKSGASYVKKDNEHSFSTAVRFDDLKYWNTCTFPVVFIVYHPKDDALYFKEVKAYIQATENVWQPPLEIVFDKSKDEFTANAKDSICDHAAVSPPRLSFEEKEQLFSNLLAVSQLPKTLTFAKTRRTSDRRIRDEIEGYIPPFCIHEKLLYTLSDLRNERNVLRNFCDVKNIWDLPTSDWFEDTEMRGHFVFLINSLFGTHCHRLGLAYSREYRRTYFPRMTKCDTDKKIERTWTSPRTRRSDIRTVVQRYEYGSYVFWRHHATEFSFVQFGNKWFLQVSPKYFFTKDGRTPCDPAIVGPYTTRLKALEHNPQVMNHVLFWADTLADGRHRIEIKLFGETLIVIEKEPAKAISPFAIPFDPATFEEAPSSAQLMLFGLDESEEVTDEL
ncbi:DUF4365 domain-containing protein [Bremerella alba]|uniref:DUF4365 domain-containing protein n=1 Tax=Bremerella alba TaxID=980252 RepID=A0A7V9A928_9BACT|nr:DUF4365 domain-containing protein [Bremerella alba]MBA2116706.1 hypothetical protein [Bremerella alba]